MFLSASGSTVHGAHHFVMYAVGDDGAVLSITNAASIREHTEIGYNWEEISSAYIHIIEVHTDTYVTAKQSARRRSVDFEIVRPRCRYVPS